MDRNSDLSHKAQAFFQAVGQLVGRGRKGQDRGAQHQEDQTHRHKGRKFQALPGHLKKADLKDRCSRCQEQIEADADEEQDHNGFQPAHHKFYRHPGQADGSCQKQGGQAVGPYRIRNEQRHDIYQGPKQLCPGIHPVEHRVHRVILAQRNIS